MNCINSLSVGFQPMGICGRRELFMRNTMNNDYYGKVYSLHLPFILLFKGHWCDKNRHSSLTYWYIFLNQNKITEEIMMVINFRNRCYSSLGGLSKNLNNFIDFHFPISFQDNKDQIIKKSWNDQQYRNHGLIRNGILNSFFHLKLFSSKKMTKKWNKSY